MIPVKDKLEVISWLPILNKSEFFPKTKRGLWTIGKTNLSHNHPVTDNLGGISTARALTKEEKAIVRDLASSGTGAAPTLAYLRDKTGNQWTTRKEIYNEKVVARAEFLDGRSPIQALYDEICSGDFIFNVHGGFKRCTKWPLLLP
ncbi:hypothetical protein BASA62_003290 [Batrachochytrium salamandrivorans]|nr:hypothetical protein BASA62_003290 [Batrachochytrium salamandrivorans]